MLSYRALDALGVSRQDVRRALESGDIRRVRTRWFAVGDAPGDVVRAVRVGGSLTGASLARLADLWVLADPVLHVRVPRTASRLLSPDGSGRPLDARRHRVCVHYRTVPHVVGHRDPLPLALAEMFACGPALAARIALDSALNRLRLDEHGLAELRRLAPAAAREMIERADRGAQSGLETIIRALLQGMRVQVRTQVWFAGIGRVDLLIGDRLIIEVDGEEFHTGLEFERDRRRDFELALRGYRVVRLSYRMVIEDFDRVHAGLRELIARREHRWGARAVASEQASDGSIVGRFAG